MRKNQDECLESRRLSKKGNKFSDAQPCLTDNGSKGTRSEFFMIGDRNGGERLSTTHNDMAACLTNAEKADFL